MIDLRLGDCLEIMKEIPDKSVDMVLCDLPYGVTQNKLDLIIPFEPLWEQYERVIKDNGIILLFAQGLFYVDLVNSNRKLFRYDLTWDKVLKSGFLNANKMPLRQHEQIAVFYKKLPTYNPQFFKGTPSHSQGEKCLVKDNVNQNYGKYKVVKTNTDTDDKYPTSIISFPKPHPSVAKHPTQKPVELLEYLIKTYTNEGDTVLDCFMGIGSSGVASKKNNRNFIGCEIDEKYFKVAEERINGTFGKTKIEDSIFGL